LTGAATTISVATVIVAVVIPHLTGVRTRLSHQVVRCLRGRVTHPAPFSHQVVRCLRPG
jgi:hypothetical protein